jgi:hypothetical protein
MTTVKGCALVLVGDMFPIGRTSLLSVYEADLGSLSELCDGIRDKQSTSDARPPPFTFSASSCHEFFDMSGGFSSTELQTALNEVASWGLDLQQPYQILPDHLAPKGEARAQINLLEEGHSAVIGVSDKGWKIALRTIVDPRVRSIAVLG